MGWSAYGGQTLSAYRREGLPEEDQPSCGGSSSGPAVSITAGFAPLGIGTETGGSTVFPASLAGLFALTLPHNSVPIDGVCRISKTFDRIGLMARDPRDLSLMARALVRSDEYLTKPLQEHAAPSENLWSALSIGVLDSEWGTDSASKWKWGSAQVVSLSRWTFLPRTSPLTDHSLEREIRLSCAWHGGSGCSGCLPSGRRT